MKERITFIPGWAAGEGIWDPVIAHLPETFTAATRSWTELLELRHQRLQNICGETCGHQENLSAGPGANASSPESRGSPKQFLAGWSLGAMLALQASVLSAEHLTGLILIAGTAQFIDENGRRGTAPSRIRAMQKRLLQNREALLEGFFRAAREPSRNPAPADITALVKQSEPIETGDLLKGLDYLVQADLRYMLPDITIPVLLLHGDNDGIIPFSAAQYLNDHLPHATLVSFPQEGHLLPLCRCRETAAHITDFCHDCDSGN
jgi:pimeloyl-[acyl-carrier protein] methyl ester esterase